MTCSQPDLRSCPSERVMISLTSFIAQFDRFPRMLLALWAAVTTRQRLILHLRSEPFGTRPAVEALTPSFSLPPIACDYHEPRVEAFFHKGTPGPSTGHDTWIDPCLHLRICSGPGSILIGRPLLTATQLKAAHMTHSLDVLVWAGDDERALRPCYPAVPGEHTDDESGHSGRIPICPQGHKMSRTGHQLTSTG